MSLVRLPCPGCRRHAPIVYRNGGAFCSACQTARVPLTSPSVNLAGRPSRVGGKVAKGVGIASLILGLPTAVVFLGLAWLIEPMTLPFKVLAAFIALVSIAASALMFWLGRSLRRRGDRVERDAREAAIVALAQQNGGLVTAAMVARLHQTNDGDADAMLTAMAMRDERVTVDVSDAGEVIYRFLDASPAPRFTVPEPRPLAVVQQVPPSPQVEHVRVAAPPVQAGARADGGEQVSAPITDEEAELAALDEGEQERRARRLP